jgi:hypothetical protein
MKTLIRAAVLLMTTAAFVCAETASPVAQNERPNPQATRQTPAPAPQPPRVYGLTDPPDVAAAKRNQQNAFTCTVPDSDARFNVDSVMTYRGQSYRCVEVYVPDKPSQGAAALRFSGMGWIKEGGAQGR